MIILLYVIISLDLICKIIIINNKKLYFRPHMWEYNQLDRNWRPITVEAELFNAWNNSILN